MSDSDQHASVDTKEKKSMQFSIAFLLGLTAACAFVLGTATWAPCSLNPVLATGIAAILAIAYQMGKQALRCSLIFGVATTAIACGDRLVDVVRFGPSEAEHTVSVFEVLLFAIIGLAGGFWLATLPSNREQMNPPEETEHRPSQVSQDE